MRKGNRKRSLGFVLSCVLGVVTTSRAQDLKGFEGGWTGTFTVGNKAPRTWTFVFENVSEKGCTGYLWNGERRPWTKCEMKDGEITVYIGTANPVVTGKLIGQTEMELAWGAKKIRFTATKQSPEFLKTLVTPSVIAGVDESPMGIYRALAGLIAGSVEQKNWPAAAKLCRILELAWDKGEGDLSKSNPDVWREIDRAMDEFVGPIMAYETVHPDPVKLETSYHSYLNKLKEAEPTK